MSEKQGLTGELEKARNGKFRAEAQYEALQAQTEQAGQRQREQFSALAAEALRKNNESFVSLANELLEKQVDRSAHAAGAEKEKIIQAVKPLGQALKRQEEILQAYQQGTKESVGGLKGHIEQLAQAQKSLEQETHNLVSALKNPTVRGRWGEIGLRRIVEFSGLNAYCDFDEQVHLRTNQSSVRPDMVINLPEGHKIIVDAKLPLEAYLKAMEAETEKQEGEQLKQHAKHLGQHVKMLGQKAYSTAMEGATDFVVLYIEVEPAFGAALRQDPGLVERALAQGVLLATPTTLISLLQTIAYTWREHKANENAQEIWQQGKIIYERLAVYTEHLNKLGYQLGQTVNTFNTAVGSWEHRLRPVFERFEELGVGSAKKELKDVPRVDVSPKSAEKESGEG